MVSHQVHCVGDSILRQHQVRLLCTQSRKKARTLGKVGSSQSISEDPRASAIYLWPWQLDLYIASFW